jgi:hypothetical protein
MGGVNIHLRSHEIQVWRYIRQSRGVPLVSRVHVALRLDMPMNRLTALLIVSKFGKQIQDLNVVSRTLTQPARKAGLCYLESPRCNQATGVRWALGPK